MSNEILAANRFEIAVFDNNALLRFGLTVPQDLAEKPMHAHPVDNKKLSAEMAVVTQASILLDFDTLIDLKRVLDRMLVEAKQERSGDENAERK